MPIVTLFSGTFCKEDLVVRDILSSTGYRLITDGDLVREAGRTFHIPEKKVGRAFSAKTSVFNRFTHEKETAVAFLKCALSGMLLEDHTLVTGFSGRLLPSDIGHVLRVCLIGDTKTRVGRAMEALGLSEKEAVRTLRARDEDCAAWVRFLHGHEDPWSPDLYDLMIPMDKTEVEKAGALIAENLVKEAVRCTEDSKNALSDFRLGARVDAVLASEGHHVGVAALDGHVVLTINKHVLMLSRLSEDLTAAASGVPGVRSVETRVGKDFHQSDVYRKHDFELPAKVLLVDDERDFVQTLSERLELREMGSAVAYDGASALEIVREDDPEVMILDLKMPGISGLEVLQQVKSTRPEIEVIVLTGHGADADRRRCMALGAFGYLQKPVDIDQLSDMLKQAHEKIRRRKSDANGHRA